MKNTFRKEERLCSKSLIDRLFHNGSSFVVYPYRVVFLCIEKELLSPVQVITSVSKRRFKSAVHRNTIKRKIREVYRVRKQVKLYPLLSASDVNLLLAIQYIAKEQLDFSFLSEKMDVLLEKLIHELGKINMDNN